MISQDTISSIIEASLIEDVVGEFVTLKKRGANYLGNCPFHNEKTPSFTVSPAKGIYKCFGCGVSGNAVKFVMEHEHYSYPEALKFLAGKYGIEVEEKELTPEQKQTESLKESLYIVSNYAAGYFKDQMHNTDAGKSIALGYFIERGFREDIIEKFGLGYNPDEWEAFTKSAIDEGYKLEFLDKSGLTIVKENKQFDRFKGRVMFPIHNLSGRVIGFGGRILKNDAKAAKYLNSPESDIYNKSKVLYGIYFAKKSIVQNDNCYLVEGYTDVISMYQAGVENVVASSGTSLTEGQIRLIRRFTSNITILYDGDAAGLKASFRGIDMILQEGMNVRVVLFPEGEDPDSYSKKVSATELEEYIASNAKDFIQFKTSVLIKEVGNDPIKRAELIKEIVTSIAVIPDQIKRSVYIQECSSLMQIGEQALLSELNKLLRKNQSKQSNQPVDELPPVESFPNIEKEQARDIAGEEEHWEKEIIRLLLNYGHKEISVSINTEEGEQEQEVVAAVYIVSVVGGDEISFKDPVFQQIFNYYVEEINKENIPSQEYFIHHQNQALSEVVISLLSEKYSISSNWGSHNIIVTTEEHNLRIAVFNTVYALKLSKLNSLIKSTQEKLKTEEFKDDLSLVSDLQGYQETKKILSDKLGRVILK